jgi:hypothetical protein
MRYRKTVLSGHIFLKLQTPPGPAGRSEKYMGKSCDIHKGPVGSCIYSSLSEGQLATTVLAKVGTYVLSCRYKICQ